MPVLRRNTPLALVATKPLDLHVLQIVKQLQLQESQRCALRDKLRAELHTMIGDTVSLVKLQCAAFSFEITVSEDTSEASDDAPAACGERCECDLSQLGEDGSLESLRTAYDSGGLTLARLCDIKMLGNLANAVLADVTKVCGSGAAPMLDGAAVLSLAAEGALTQDAQDAQNPAPECAGEQSQSQATTDGEDSVVRFVCSSLVSRIANIVAIALAVAADKMLICADAQDPSGSSRRASFVVASPLNIVMQVTGLNTQHVSHLRQAVTYAIQDCILNRLVFIT